MRYYLSVILVVTLQVLCARAEAAATQSDLLVAARTLGFMEKPPKGDVNTGIVYVPENAASLTDAQDLQRKLGDGLRAGNLTLKPILVKLDDLADADVGLVLLAAGAGNVATKLVVVVAAKRLPCITFDISQVQNGSCAMWVRASPKVEILVNRAAAAASGITFATPFRMMISEF